MSDLGSPISADNHDRLITLEAEVRYMRRELDNINAKVNAMHDLLQQGKGAKWVLFALATGSGFIAAKFGAVISFLVSGGKP